MISGRSFSRRRRISPWFLVILILIILLVLGMPSPSETDEELGMKDKYKITKLIYPTLGNPSITKSGNNFTVEFDPREQNFDQPFIPLYAFQAEVRSSNDKYPVIKKLPVFSFKVGYSSRWPEYKKTGTENRRIYLVTIGVPDSLPHDLYDLTVKAEKEDGTWLTDAQPHALQAVDSYHDPFSFCQLTDIHVFGPECSYPAPSCTYHQRSERPNGEDSDRKGAIYYQKAIAQINRIKPDFCVFSGDYMFGQAYFTQDQGPPWGETTEYQYEMSWFYEETLKLDVPVFMSIGNHDGYNEGDNAAEEDWFTNWRKLFGPLYHSFDYGDYHFLVLNSMDWDASERTLDDSSGIILQPTKYMGQFRSSGDPWASGVTRERLAQIDESKLKGQLAWIRDDLSAHRDAKMRICVMHHDPWRTDSYGDMWASFGARKGDFVKSLVLKVKGLLDMGNGEGRLAIIKLMLDNEVALEVSGHEHSDYVGSIPWTSGVGELLFVNTVCTQFPEDGESERYPGYRRVWINKGKVESYNYKEPYWSYPWYEGTNVGKTTDLGSLETPAIVSTFKPEPGNAQDLACTVENHLEKPLPNAYIEFPMPYSPDGYYYEVSNGTFSDVYDVQTDSSFRRICQVYADVAPGEKKIVRVHRNTTPEEKAPTGTLEINDGATTTTSTDVTLDISARDEGGAGLKDMMISNTPDFRSAEWERYRSKVPWALSSGTPGERTVYIKLRDRSMPGNVSPVIESSIAVSPNPALEEPARTWYFTQDRRHPGFEEWLNLENSNGEDCNVYISYKLEKGKSITQKVAIPVMSGFDINTTTLAGNEQIESIAVESALPLTAERQTYFKPPDFFPQKR